MASVYYFLTMVLLGARLETHGFLGIYCSVVFWRWYSRIADGAPTILISYAQIIKQTNFPTHTIILATVAVESVHMLFGLVVLLCLVATLSGEIHPTILLFPIIFCVQLSVIMFFAISLSCVGVFFKDLGGLIFAFNGIWFYLSPGIYPIEMVPQEFLVYYYANPFAHVLPAYHDILLNGVTPDFFGLFCVFTIFSALNVWVFRIVNRSRKHFFNFM